MTLSTLNRINEWLRFEAHIFLVYNLVKGKRCVEMVHILFQLKKGFEKQRDSNLVGIAEGIFPNLAKPK